jgi:hypothetical protein
MKKKARSFAEFTLSLLSILSLSKDEGRRAQDGKFAKPTGYAKLSLLKGMISWSYLIFNARSPGRGKGAQVWRFRGGKNN